MPSAPINIAILWWRDSYIYCKFLFKILPIVPREPNKLCVDPMFGAQWLVLWDNAKRLYDIYKIFLKQTNINYTALLMPLNTLYQTHDVTVITRSSLLPHYAS